MSFEVRPQGVQCNLRCQYCYQNAERDATQNTGKYDLPMLLERLEKEEEDFSMFGGEPMLLPIHDLEKLLALGLEKHGGNTIQTNGTLFTPAHIELFQKYKVSVGISMDGPGALNDGRWAGSLVRTRNLTAKSEQALDDLRAADIPTSLIITLHRNNATADKLPLMSDWLRYLDSIGIESARLHVLEVDDPQVAEKYELSPEENYAALLHFENLERELKTLHLDVFGEMIAMLTGDDRQAACVWRACDPYTTEAVQGIEGDGQQSNCGRTNKEGVGFVKSKVGSYHRYMSLYMTPQPYGGCAGCRFFLMCKGQCPGTAIDGDWRNRTSDCNTWKQLFIHLERRLTNQGQTPLSLHPARKQVEEVMIQAWASGQNPALEDVRNYVIQEEQAENDQPKRANQE